MAMEVKQKRVEPEAVPGQLASGQTLRFDPFFQDSVTADLIETVVKPLVSTMGSFKAMPQTNRG